MDKIIECVPNFSEGRDKEKNREDRGLLPECGRSKAAGLQF